MCGILGIISRSPDSRLDDPTIIAMRDTMVDRGPDDSGLFREGPIALGHRRLAIRDIDHGQQPWISQNGRFVVVYNGEIYNDQEIARELAAEGIHLKTSCDTEVLAEAWSLWGEDCIQRLRGMFAFAMVDRKLQTTWLVRDRCGIKPLYYSMVDGDLVFASSIAAIRRHPRFSSQPNFATLSHYMQTLRITFGAETVFKNVYTLMPAELIRFQDQKRVHKTYWSLPSPQPTEEVEFEDAVARLQTVLDQSVRLRLKSDVDVGMMMSGGVDSNTLASLTHRHGARSMVGVCGGGSSQSKVAESGNDFEFARDCADGLGFDYAEVRVSDDDYLSTWESLIGGQETPLATPTDAIIYQVARRLKKSCGVALGGEGADEAFCGYAIPHWSGNDFDNASQMSRLGSLESSEFRESLLKQYGRDQFDSMADHYLSLNGLIPGSAQRALLNPDCFAQGSERSIPSYYQRLFASQGNVPMAHKYARVLMQANLESLLRRLDTATMAAGLEARVPYADHLVVECAFQLPHHFKIDVCPTETRPWLASWELAKRGSLRTKRVLRELASRMMPKRLALRPKMSFPTPLVSWLGKNWKPWIENKLRTSAFAQQVFQPDALRQVNGLPDSLALWKWPILNTILWGERCFA